MATNATVNDFRPESTNEIFKIEEGQDEFSRTYIFGNEDHTLGNSLKHVLLQQLETDFCGYSVPHPYEPKIHLRLQSRKVPADKILHTGLSHIVSACNIVDEEFDKAVNKYYKSSSKKK